MKNLLYSLLAILALASCSKEEQAPPPPPTPTYTLSFSAEDGGSVSTEGGTYNQGSKITVTATPDAQYLFKEWSDGSTTNPREITVTSNLTLKASFIKKTYPLAVTIEGEGTVQEEVIIQGSTSETEYNAGTTVRLTATPNEGWVFAGWSGDIESDALEIEVPIEKGTAVSALFKRDSFELNITIEGEGTVKEEVIVQPGQYDYETVVRLTAIPEKCWTIGGWEMSGEVISNSSSIELTLTSSISITLNFDEVPGRDILPFNDISYNTNNYYDTIFNAVLALENTISNPLDAVAVDYNMDGYLDLVHTNSNYAKSGSGEELKNKIKFYLGDCEGTFEEDDNLSGLFDGLIHGRKGLIGDYNLDGYPDIFFAGHGIDVTPYSGEYPILLINNARGGFELLEFDNLIGFFHTAASGDYDNDGDLDIVLTSINKTYILQNDNGSFTIIEDDIHFDARNKTDFLSKTIVPQLDAIFTSELFDINNDGYLDYVVAGHDWGENDIRETGFQSRVLLGNGNSFTDGELLIPRIDGFGVVLDINFYDIDADGDTEIIFSRTGDNVNGLGNYIGWYIQVLELDGSQYIDRTESYIDDYYSYDDFEIYRLHIADLDNDGVIDLFNDQLELKENNGDDILYKVWKLNNGKFIRAR